MPSGVRSGQEERADFGQRMLLARTKRGLLQAEVGEQVGVTAETVSRWERGSTRSVQARLRGPVAKFLEVDLEELYGLLGLPLPRSNVVQMPIGSSVAGESPEPQPEPPKHLAVWFDMVQRAYSADDLPGEVQAHLLLEARWAADRLDGQQPGDG